LIHVPTGTALERTGAERLTTNNRMEMSGAIEALRWLKRGGVPIEIRSDSKYLVDMCTKWIPGWKRKGWKRQGKDEIKNLDLVKELDRLTSEHEVSWKWVRGHGGEPGNEYVDALANLAMDNLAEGGSGVSERRHEKSPVSVSRR
jgi:ribonuclease HI